MNNSFKLCGLSGNSRSTMVDGLEYDTVVSEFELQLRHNVNFLTNALGKCVNPLSPSYSFNCSTTVLLEEWL